MSALRVLTLICVVGSGTVAVLDSNWHALILAIGWGMAILELSVRSKT